MPSGAHQGCDAPFTTVKGDIVMAPNPGFDQLLLATVVLLCLMIHGWWPAPLRALE
jgi:hypothetical protein